LAVILADCGGPFRVIIVDASEVNQFPLIVDENIYILACSKEW
jgi:hypothetical protein